MCCSHFLCTQIFTLNIIYPTLPVNSHTVAQQYKLSNTEKYHSRYVHKGLTLDCYIWIWYNQAHVQWTAQSWVSTVRTYRRYTAVTAGSLKISTVLFLIKTSTNKPRMWTSSPWRQVGRLNRNSTLHKTLEKQLLHLWLWTNTLLLHGGEPSATSVPPGATALTPKLVLHAVNEDSDESWNPPEHFLHSGDTHRSIHVYKQNTGKNESKIIVHPVRCVHEVKKRSWNVKELHSTDINWKLRP